MQPPQGPSSTGLVWFMLVVRSPAVVLDVIAHRRFGSRYFDLRAGIAALVLWVIPLCFHRSSPWATWGLLVVYLVMLARARLEVLWFARQGLGMHSRHNGYPVLCRWRPSLSELTVKRFIEPGLAVFIGWAAARWLNVPLGWAVVVCGLSAFFETSTTNAVQSQRHMDLHDAIHDAQAFRDFRR